AKDTAAVAAWVGAGEVVVRLGGMGGGSPPPYADTFAVNPTNMQVSIKDHPGDCAGMGVWPPADPCPTTAKAGFGAQKIVDFSQSPPAQVGTYRSPTSTVWPPPDNGLYVPSQARPFGKDLMLTAWHSDGLRVVDISNPAAPFETASFVPPAVADPSAAAGAGPSNRAGAVGTCGVVPVACMTRGISWPTKPLVTSVAVVPTGANTGIVVLSDINAGLYVLNMTVDRKNKPPADFDGNGSTDRSVYRPSTGQWFVNGGSPEVTNYGATGDLPVPADYDGGGTADKAVYRPSTGQWFVSGGSPEITNFGSPGDIPVPADYDGNGSADKAVFRPSTGQWFYQGGPPTGTVYGTNGDIPVPGDYNGDGVADIAIYRPTTGQWFTLVSGVSTLTSYGTAGDIPVPADYDADDDTDIAVYRPSTGQWFRLLNGVTSVTTYGAPGTPPAGDIPVPGDYDADGDADLAVYRQSTGQWFTLLNGVTTTIVYGAAGDMPLPLPYAIRSVYFP
ncbi:MAG: FG-GAP-like repeat-containing protein, partial [Acidimicrobiales bacterium]